MPVEERAARIETRVLQDVDLETPSARATRSA
jgi:hypothetical protein